MSGSSVLISHPSLLLSNCLETNVSTHSSTSTAPLKSSQVFHYRELQAALLHSPLKPLADALPELIEKGLCDKRFGDLPGWRNAYLALPSVNTSLVELKSAVVIGQESDTSADEKAAIAEQLRALIPWRKGPFTIHGAYIDTEWRSDWKWDRVIPHISPLAGKTVLDIGCGSGYHCWRMLGEGAARVIGVDPSPRFIVQFHMVKHFAGNHLPIDVLPLGIEDLPPKLKAFDTVFSMGVLYHRRSPIDHLIELKDLLTNDGQLVLETLVIDGKLGEVLVPEGRYAMMNNVWFLPSVETMLSWLRKVGFKNPRVVDVNKTTTEEQRSTEWMKFHSLSDFLDPNDSSKTVEGHPAPVRAVFVAEA